MQSHHRVAAAWETGLMQREVIPVPIPPRYKSAADRDNGIRPGQSMEALARLKPVFDRRRIRTSTELFRFLMMALIVVGLGRAVGLMGYAPERKIIVGIAIEVIVPLVLLWTQSRIRACTVFGAPVRVDGDYSAFPLAQSPSTHRLAI